MSHRTDHYAILGVPASASADEIRRAYRRIARDTHPDVNPGDREAERRFKRASAAYETLADPGRRERYDARHTWGRFAAPGTGPGPSSYQVDAGPIYHSDLGHHSDFYQAGDPLTVTEAAALTGRHPAWLRKAIRSRRLGATRLGGQYFLRRRDVEALDRSAARRRTRPARASAEAREEAAVGPELDGAEA